MHEQQLSTAPDSSRAAAILNFLAGVWLVTSPFFFDFAAHRVALGVSLVAGVAVLVLAGLRLADVPHRVWPSWVNLALGVCLALAPFVVGQDWPYQARWNGIALGIVVSLLAAWGLRDTPQAQRMA